MGAYVIRRLLLFIPMLVAISVITFILIQLPPGDYLTSEIMAMAERGEEVDEAVIAALKLRYGLDRPMVEQYFRWITNIIFEGDFGALVPLGTAGVVADLGAAHVDGGDLVRQPVVHLGGGVPDRHLLGHQPVLDRRLPFTFFGFLGKATPNFLLALVLMWLDYVYFDFNMGGLFSAEYQKAPWSLAKAGDLISHLWVPLVVLGTAGTADLIRVLRANLLDELAKPYVTAARAKGLTELKLIAKYPVRIAINPFVSSIGGVLPELISGAAIVSVVLSLPTTGPLMLGALLTQDMFLAGSFLMLLTVLSLIGTLLSDILLALLDPRIRQTV